MSDWIKRFIPFASLIALCVIIAALEPRFLSSGNLASVARQTTVITVMAMGMTMVMVSGGIDLSVGSMLALAGVIGALVMAPTSYGPPIGGAPVPVGILVAIAAGAFFGCVNGLAVATLRIP